MVLGISEDFTNSIVLDAELTALPESGLCLNSGVHPSITVDNLLEFLPSSTITLVDWDVETTYSKYALSKKRSDLVTVEGVIYQSLQIENIGKDPATETEYWLETNIESLNLKAFLDKVKDKVYADLNLTKRLVNNQFIYEVGQYDYQLPNQYAAWIFEPKGSDYVTITINQIAFQKSGVEPVNLYVINQGVLVDTLELTPNNGKLEFEDLNYSFKGPGKWIFAIDSTLVKTNNQGVDPLKYDGFVCYTATGTGEAPQDAVWSNGTTGNGLGFNVSVTLNSSVYIDNNVNNLGNFIRATFELLTLQMFLHNSNNRSNRSSNIQIDRELLMAETKSLELNTVAKRYQTEFNRARKVIEKTFDTQLGTDDEFQVEVNSL